MGVRDETERAAYGSSRVSPQRRAIALAADAATTAFSPEDLLAAVRRSSPGVGAATVYRALGAMESAGFVEAVGVRDGATLYSRCRRSGHHHHVVCTSCGSVAETGCSFDPSAEVTDTGFTISSHSLVLYGLCARCQQEEPVSSDKSNPRDARPGSGDKGGAGDAREG